MRRPYRRHSRGHITDELLSALRHVASGGLVIDPRVARALLAHAASNSPPPALTPTEQAVADLVALGWPNAEIAAQLHFAHGTVKNTVSALLRKLGHDDRTSLALHLAGSARAPAKPDGL